MPARLSRLVPYLGRPQAGADIEEELRLHLEFERERQQVDGVREADVLRSACQASPRQGKPDGIGRTERQGAAGRETQRGQEILLEPNRSSGPPMSVGSRPVYSISVTAGVPTRVVLLARSANRASAMARSNGGAARQRRQLITVPFSRR